jgi:signal transduction histidine kinase
VDARGFLRRHGDRLLALTLVAGVVIQAWLTFGVRGGDAIRPRDALALVVAFLLAASLAWRRRAPLLVLALAIAAAAVSVTEPIDAPLALVIAMTIATYSVGANATGRAAVLGGIGVAVLVGVAVAKDLGPDQDINDVAVPVLILGTPWLAGLSLRSRREREVALEGLRVEHANAAVADERARIARDLHDAVAHSIGVIILQARGARRTFRSDPDAAMEALDAIETTGTAALAEMRGLVGVLRDDGQPKVLTPPPSLRHVGSLVATVREAGLPVDLSIEGTPVGLPAGMDASAYRIVQEALTNALAHAGPATANVVIRYGPEDLDLEIGDTGVGPRDLNAEGHGLTGMRQRVSFHDGRLEVGPRPGGGFLVRASLPLRAPGT